MRKPLSTLSAAAVVVAASLVAARADTVVLPEITVVGSTPVPGSGVARDLIPARTYVLDSSDISFSGVPALTDAITREIPSATVNDVEGNPFQPDIVYRGFVASPVAGTPQGLAVYVNGARFNDPFGDSVNWDLIPSVAVQSVTIESSNPLFGLNALGGSVNVQLKNGFTFQGGDLSTYAGSYGRVGTNIEYGRQVGDFAVYGSGEVIEDGGFQPTGSSQIQRAFVDLGWRGPGAELHLDVLGANNRLGNPGASPVQALQANLGNIFTAPNTVTNQYLGLNLHGSYAVDSTLSVQGVAYLQGLDQKVPNGTTVDIAACNDGSGLVCNGDGSYVTTTGGATVPDIWNGGPYSGLSSQSLSGRAYGASLQATDTSDIFGRQNHFVLGASFDGSDSTFSGETWLGGFDPVSRFFLPPAVVLVQPDAGINPVKVQGVDQYYGVFGQDILSLTPNLNLIVAGRYNLAQINLSDRFGGPVNGQNTFAHLNPSVGLTYQALSWLQVYGSYAVTNRAPTPQELSCASAANPCSLLNFFVGDPPLKQVVADTFEVGARGAVGEALGGRWTWNADLYHTVNNNDIVYETTAYNPNLAYYVNAGQTLRQGAEVTLHYDTAAVHAQLGYAYTDAIFLTPLLLGSASNPLADANGNIQVQRGDRVPGIPQNRITGQIDYNINDKWVIGGSASWQSGFYRYGDEANLNPPVDGYWLANLHTSYKVTDRMTAFALVNNVFNSRYDTYGTFGPVGAVPWPSVPGGVTSSATAVPGRPFSAYGGVTITF